MRLAYLFADSDQATKIVAWWGAVLGSIVFLWDIYKWRTKGAQIRMTLQPDRRVQGDSDLEAELEGKTQIIIMATNVGDRPTTLENLVCVWYANWWNRIRRKHEKGYFIKNPGRGRSFPCKLEIGDRWDGMSYQSEEIVQLANTGHLIFELYYASSKRPIRQRLKSIGLERFPARKHTAS